jgi:hypothetical protein
LRARGVVIGRRTTGKQNTRGGHGRGVSQGWMIVHFLGFISAVGSNGLEKALSDCGRHSLSPKIMGRQSNVTFFFE